VHLDCGALGSVLVARSLAERFLAAQREALAFARQAVLLPRDVQRPLLPADGAVGPDDDVVVFLHGLLASAGVLRPLREHVTRHPGVHGAALTYAPGLDVAALSERLAELLAALPTHARVHLVGHSLGGIVCRHLAAHRPDPRVVQTISLASPFGGVRAASLVALRGVRDLAEDSAVLRALRLAACEVPHFSIIAADDGVAGCPVAHALPGFEVVVLDRVGHNALLFDPRATAHVERLILAARAARRAAAGAS
jgi:triacylglycerol lipase